MYRRSALAALFAAGLALSLLACGCEPAESGAVVTFPGSAVGAEAEVLRLQLDRFRALHPDIEVVTRRTPDAADQRHQLYVQWLNAGAGDPDVLQLDVIWTPEFAAAGWILPLDRFEPEADAFFPATVRANRWRGTLYAVPWFVDVGMLYYRSDIVSRPPETLDGLIAAAADAVGNGRATYGWVWQGARYEGLVCVFLEHLGAFGGRILDDAGRVAVNSEAAVRALTFMRDSMYGSDVVPREVLAWQEEPVRFAFQNGLAVFMRNWPYAAPLLRDPETSRVAGRFGVAPVPGTAEGAPTAALGGSQLAINRRSEHPEAAWTLVDFLTRPEQMKERARVAGQYPTRHALYDEDLGLPITSAEARRIIEGATPRPVTPVYTELSQILQVWLHRALSEQVTPPAALEAAAAEMTGLLERAGLAGDAAGSEDRHGAP
jgi:multiple sugar transport system substrate-binding protein